MSLKLGVEDAEQWLEDCPDRVYKNWYAAYQCEPFGGETELLARIASLLYIIASKGSEIESVSKACDAITKTLMPGDWVGANKQTSSLDNFKADEMKEQFRAMGNALAGAFA